MNEENPITDTSQKSRPSRLYRNYRLAADLATPPSTLSRLSRHGDNTVRERAAANPSTPPEDLLRVLQEDTRSVAARAASNPATPLGPLAEHAPRSFACVRQGAARNPAAPAQLLEALRQVAERRKKRLKGELRTIGMTYTQQAKLRDTITEEEEALAAIARNPNVPPDILARLLAGSAVKGSLVSTIMTAVAESPNATAEMLQTVAPRCPLAVARNPLTTKEVLREVAATEIEHAVARKAFGEEIPEHLAFAIIDHPNTPPDLAADIERLLRQDPSASALKTIRLESVEKHAELAHSASTAYDRAQFRIAHLLVTDPSAITVSDLSVHGPCPAAPGLLRRVAAHQASSEAVLRDLQHTDDRGAVLALIGNPSTPLDALEDLMAHDFQMVWMAAAEQHHART